jgi:2-hydroxychromene-2-carboxylate isomerase
VSAADLGRGDEIQGESSVSGKLPSGATEPAQLEFWFEFASTYSYPAAERVEAAAAQAGVSLRWRPFLLGPLFAAQGWNDSPFNLYPVKGAYMWRDMERLCSAAGLTLRRPSRFPRNGLLPARVALAAEGEAWQPEFVRAVYRANFAEDREIADPGVVGAILEALGQSAGEWLERAAAERNKVALRRQTEAAQRLGLFGAPSFVAKGELFWGGDRLDAALAWARSADPGSVTIE